MMLMAETALGMSLSEKALFPPSSASLSTLRVRASSLSTLKEMTTASSQAHIHAHNNSCCLVWERVDTFSRSMSRRSLSLVLLALLSSGASSRLAADVRSCIDSGHERLTIFISLLKWKILSNWRTFLHPSAMA